jgi:hypothetical protein
MTWNDSTKSWLASLWIHSHYCLVANACSSGIMSYEIMMCGAIAGRRSVSVGRRFSKIQGTSPKKPLWTDEQSQMQTKHSHNFNNLLGTTSYSLTIDILLGPWHSLIGCKKDLSPQEAIFNRLLTLSSESNQTHRDTWSFQFLDQRRCTVHK